jgi:hypothetical protein
VPWRQRIPAAVAAAHAQGAVAILAHPAGDAFRRTITDEGLRAVDGIEVAHPLKELSDSLRADFARVYARTVALNPRTAAIGSSDFHYFAPLGVSRTYLFVRQPTPLGVLEAIRAARTIACDPRGRTFGPPRLAALVADRCRADAAAPVDGRLAGLATLLVWAGLLTLVLAGVSDR